MDNAQREDLVSTLNIFAFNYSIQNLTCGDWNLHMGPTSDLQPAAENDDIEVLLLEMANIMLLLMQNSEFVLQAYGRIYNLREICERQFQLTVRCSAEA